MRRKDREVTDLKTVTEIIDACPVIRLGLADGDFPYVVPLNFAYTVSPEGQIAFYVHGAMAGRKYELMRKNRRCSFEMDVPLGMECMAERGSVTMRYRCVMGTAEIDFLEGREKQEAVDKIFMARYELTRGFAYDKKLLERTAVARLTVTGLSAKQNPAVL